MNDGASRESGTVKLGGVDYHLIPKTWKAKEKTDYDDLEEVTLRKGTADEMLCLQTSYDKLLGRFGNPKSLSSTEEETRLQKAKFAQCATDTDKDTLNLQTFLIRDLPTGGFVLHPKYYKDEQDMCLKSGSIGAVEVGRCALSYNDDKWKIEGGKIKPFANSNVRMMLFCEAILLIFSFFFALRSACLMFPGRLKTTQRSVQSATKITRLCPSFQSVVLD